MPDIMGKAKYPEYINMTREQEAGQDTAHDGLAIAEECGTVKAVNVVLLGAASKDLPFSEKEWLKVIENNVKPKFIDINKKAFEMGRQV